jgi:hypothetical protein
MSNNPTKCYTQLLNNLLRFPSASFLDQSAWTQTQVSELLFKPEVTSSFILSSKPRFRFPRVIFVSLEDIFGEMSVTNFLIWIGSFKLKPLNSGSGWLVHLFSHSVTLADFPSPLCVDTCRCGSSFKARISFRSLSLVMKSNLSASEITPFNYIHCFTDENGFKAGTIRNWKLDDTGQMTDVLQDTCMQNFSKHLYGKWVMVTFLNSSFDASFVRNGEPLNNLQYRFYEKSFPIIIVKIQIMTMIVSSQNLRNMYKK